MKKILFSMLGAIVALTSCQKEDLSSSGDGREVAVSIAASLPTTMTRAFDSNKGGLDNIDWKKYSLRYTLEIYDGETVLPLSKVNAATQRVLYKESLDGARAATFDDIRLLSGKEYQFVIWADFVNKDKSTLRYSTQEKGGLKNIKRIQLWSNDGNQGYPGIGSVDYDDAYFATEKVKVESSFTQAIALKRPFAKVRVITTDIKEIVNVEVTKQTPVSVSFRDIPTGFNAYDGSIGAGTTGTSHVTTIKELTDEQGTLFCDYILVPATSTESPVQVPFKFKVECLSATYEMTTDAVKLERNKLTTVKGKLLTKGVDIDITIEDEFLTPGIEFEVPIDVATVAAAQDKLDNIDFNASGRPAAPISIGITRAVNDGAVELVIPAAVTNTNTTQIQITLAAGIASGSTFTLKQATEDEAEPAYTGEVYVMAPASTEGNMAINMPSATVYVNGKIKQLTSTMSTHRHSLIIEKEAVIGTLTLNQGHIVIHGTVEQLTFTKAMFDLPAYVLPSYPEEWNFVILPEMRIIQSFCEHPVNIVNSLDGIAADSIPGAIAFNYINVDLLELYENYNKQMNKSHWIGGLAKWPESSDQAKRSSFAARLSNNYGTRNTSNIVITKDFLINATTTLDGNYTFTGAGRFVLNANLTLNGSILDATNNVGIAPVTIRSSNVTFTGNNITLNQATSGNGDGTAMSGLGIVVEESSSINNVKINLTDSRLNMNGPKGYQRAIVFPTGIAQTGMEVNLLRTDITCLTTTEMKNATYSQGIGVGALTNPKITLTDCDLTGMYYAINNPNTSPTNMELTIDNSRLSGYGVLNLRGSSTIKIKNGSVLTGRNFYPAGSNVFAAIVYNAGSINSASTLVVDNSTIQNVVEGVSQEYMIDVRNNANVTVTLQNGTKLLDETKPENIMLDYMIKDVPVGSTVTKDETVVVKGKPGVRLVE